MDFNKSKVRTTSTNSPLGGKNITNRTKVEVQLVIDLTEEVLENETISGVVLEDTFGIIIMATANNRILIKMRQHLPQGTLMVKRKPQHLRKITAIVKFKIEATSEEYKYRLTVSQKYKNPQTQQPVQKNQVLKSTLLIKSFLFNLFQS